MPETMHINAADLPLRGVKVVEFTHMVMGPTVGMVLGDLGADVIKIEPMGGDNTRRLTGSGAGYFPMYGRNKRSLCADLKSEAGRKIALDLIADADVLIENFRPGAMDALGFGYEAVSKINPRLVYCSAKGFLKGPYEHRVALDEVAQMMAGLAYMTGPPGRPLRAGASVIDVMGGVFGVVGILSALLERHHSGQGQLIKSGLFESCIFLVGQHMAQYSVTGQAAKPMPVRTSAWAIYDLFETADQEQVFVGVVTDSQWKVFCEAFDLKDLGEDQSLVKNNGRVQARDRVIPRVRALFSGFTKVELIPKLEAIGLPFAPIGKPEDMFDDPHLVAGGGLLDVTLPETGKTTSLPALPIEFGNHRLGLHHDLAQPGQHSREILSELGYEAATIDQLVSDGILAETQS